MLDGKQLIKDLYIPNSESKKRFPVPAQSNWRAWSPKGAAAESRNSHFSTDSAWQHDMLLATCNRFLSLQLMLFGRSRSLAMLSIFSGLRCCYTQDTKEENIDACPAEPTHRVHPAPRFQALRQVRSIIIWPLIRTHIHRP